MLVYAFLDDMAYRKWGALYSGDTLVEKVPRLAICSNLGKDIGPLDLWAIADEDRLLYAFQP